MNPLGLIMVLLGLLLIYVAYKNSYMNVLSTIANKPLSGSTISAKQP